MSANRSMALRVVWGTRIDDDTPAPDARELLGMLGLIEPGGHEILPDHTPAGRLLDEKGRPVATAPPPSHRPSAALKPKGPGKGKGRTPKPIEHGSDYGYQQHKRKGEPIPDDDGCGCQAAHDATLVRRRPRPEPHLSSSVLPPEVQPDELAEDIRARVDEMAPRANPDGSINASHVAMEQTLRSRAGLPSYIAQLDGPGKFLPATPLADWEKALVADPFDPDHPALHVPDGFVPGGADDDEPRQPEPRQPGLPPLDLRQHLLASCDSPRAAVRRNASRALAVLEQLHDALDDLARAQARAASRTNGPH